MVLPSATGATIPTTPTPAHRTATMVQPGLQAASSSGPVPGMDGAGGTDGMGIITVATDTTAATATTVETDIAADTTAETTVGMVVDMAAVTTARLGPVPLTVVVHIVAD